VSAAAAPWVERNRALMIAAIEHVKGSLDAHRQGRAPAADRAHALAAAIESTDPSALAALTGAFRMSPFERDILLLCAAFEMDGIIAAACAGASDPRRPYPTFGLAMAAFPGGHWSAITPNAPLRYYRLLEVDPGEGLTYGRLRIDERILHYLAGVPWLDPRLNGLLEHVPTEHEVSLIDGHRAAADRIAGMWRRWRELPVDRWSAVQICGADPGGRELVIAEACRRSGNAMLVLRSGDVPTGPLERDALARLWLRETGLSSAALVIEIDDVEHAETVRGIAALVERLRGPIVISSRDPLRLRRRAAIRVELGTATVREQEVLWRAYLGPMAERLDGAIHELATHFHLGAAGMRAVVGEITESDDLDLDNSAGLARTTWAACRRQARPRLDDLAQRIDPDAKFDDLVLPAEQMQMLRGVVAHVRQRFVVYEQWGFGRKGGRGLGITALFSGASGTGKTLAAEVLASELHLDLYRIDLSQVVSKYIGETEKHLRRIFDAAEEGGAILLFDEADALFGKRSEVKDSHDRYANLEISYLLQRMEMYRGLAILTSNMRSALDGAFTRRLRFIIEFPFPGVDERAAIWARAFPRDVPIADLAVDRLAQLNITGGIIRNIALGAAFLAADAGSPVRMDHLRQAVDLELLKLERTATEAELGEWS
jgi:ATP-dependent 26S proteasome regulatory subunit